MKWKWIRDLKNERHRFFETQTFSTQLLICYFCVQKPCLSQNPYPAYPSNKTADVASATANPTSTLPTTQANPSSVQQPHATQASHTLVPQRPTALPLQKRITAQKKRV